MTATLDQARRAPWSGAVEAIPTPLETRALDMLERCRGEGPANCVGRCPLNVDARAYMQLTKEGRFDEALQKVREKLPFPGIIGYICAHPCELHCKRIDDDSAIRIRDVKRFLADRESGEPAHILDREEPRDARVAIVGGGPAGLIAAHDLARRGYKVTVFERSERIGGCLVDKIPEYRLPRRVVERDLSIIEALGVETRLGVDVGDDVSLEDLRGEHAAVLLLAGFDGGLKLLQRDSGLRRSMRDTVRVDPLTLETGIAGVFAGGESVSGPGTVIEALALGRRAAESAHRFMSGEDLRAERSAPGPRRILWTLEIDEAERRRRERPPVMLRPYNEAITEEEARAEGERCLDCECGLCVKDCEYLAKHTHSPKDLARMILAGVADEETLKIAYSCNICSLCAQVCPEDLDTGKMILEARRKAVEEGRGPLKGHKPIVSYWKAGVSNLFTLTRPAPGRQKSKRLFFTGCALPAVAPQHTLTVYDALRRDRADTGVMMLCCGAPVELIGMEKEHHDNRELILRQAEAVGAEELLPACPDCIHALKETVPELKITPVWEALAECWTPPVKRKGETISIHDSCKAQHEPNLHKAIRQLVEKGGAKVEDIEYREELARCCGFGGMIYPVDAELSQKISKRRADESPHPMMTYCAGCRMALRGVGKSSVHVLDFLLTDDWNKKADEKAPGSIGRYVNRLRTKWAMKRLRPLGAE